jgi:hypothetical protein
MDPWHARKIYIYRNHHVENARSSAREVLLVCPIRHIIFANGHLIKGVESFHHCPKIIFLFPFQLFLARLSFVKVTFLRNKHIIIIIFNGTLSSKYTYTDIQCAC